MIKPLLNPYLTIQTVIPLLVILNIGIYFTALYTYPEDAVFAECARNSGRTSAAINLMLLLMVGFYGLKSIFKEGGKLQFFKLLVSLFAVNHLIHFMFVYQNFKIQEMELSVSENLHGILTFIGILLLPLVVNRSLHLNRALYYLILIHFINVTYFMAISFYSRYKPGIDEAYLHRIGILIMMCAILFIILKEVTGRTKEFIIGSKGF